MLLIPASTLTQTAKLTTLSTDSASAATTPTGLLPKEFALTLPHPLPSSVQLEPTKRLTNAYPTDVLTLTQLESALAASLPTSSAEISVCSRPALLDNFWIQLLVTVL